MRLFLINTWIVLLLFILSNFAYTQDKKEKTLQELYPEFLIKANASGFNYVLAKVSEGDKVNICPKLQVEKGKDDCLTLDFINCQPMLQTMKTTYAASGVLDNLLQKNLCTQDLKKLTAVSTYTRKKALHPILDIVSPLMDMLKIRARSALYTQQHEVPLSVSLNSNLNVCLENSIVAKWWLQQPDISMPAWLMAGRVCGGKNPEGRWASPHAFVIVFLKDGVYLYEPTFTAFAKIEVSGSTFALPNLMPIDAQHWRTFIERSIDNPGLLLFPVKNSFSEEIYWYGFGGPPAPGGELADIIKAENLIR